MPITSFAIDGLEVDPRLPTFEIRETVGGVSTLTCDIASSGSPVMPISVFDVVEVEEDGGTIFAGIVTQVRLRGDQAPNLYDGITGDPEVITTVTAEDYARLAERVYITATVSAGTSLAAFLATVVTQLSVVGITLHPSQVTGPNLPDMVFDRVRGSDVLQALSDATGYVSRIDYSKQLRMWLPGALAAPFNINEFDDPQRWTGDVEVERILGDDYANRITVIGDPITEYNRVEPFTGDGVTSVFQLTYTLFAHRGYVTDDTSTGTNLTLTTTPFQGSADWTYHPLTNTLERELGPLPNGQVASITFDGTFAPFAIAEDLADIAVNGLYEHVERRNDITDPVAAQALADALLASKLNAGEQLVRYSTRFVAPTLRAGQQQTITATARELSGPYVISEMRVQAEVPATTDYALGGLGLIRHITAKQQQVLLGKWQHTYRDWLGGGNRGTATPPILTGVGVVGPAPPEGAVQHYLLGQFGGKSTFKFFNPENSLICGGGGSSIDAPDHESCAVIGCYNGHIDEP